MTSPINNEHAIELSLLHRNQQHCAQAQRTPCLHKPLRSIFGEYCTNLQVNNIFQGNIPTDTPPKMTELLTKMEQKRKQQSATMLFHIMVKGLKKLREATTTTPSGKLQQLKSKKATETCAEYLQKLQSYQNLSSKTLKSQDLIINLAIPHPHALDNKKHYKIQKYNSKHFHHTTPNKTNDPPNPDSTDYEECIINIYNNIIGNIIH
jgi:hypothetical protein